jgi:ribose transport system substrate-binding protein
MKSYPLKSLACALAFVILAAGCGKQSAPVSSGPAPAKKLHLAFVTNNSSAFWTIARAGTADAAKELGNIEVDFRIPSSGSASEQQQVIDDLLAKGVDGIAVSPIDPANQTDFLNKVASQTLLVCHDSDAPASKRVAYIGTDNVAAGIEAGKLIKEALPSGGKIMVFVGTLDAQNAKERFGGIKQELAGSKIEIIDVRTDETDRVRAQKNVEDTLVKYPEVAGLVGLWSYNGPAIVNAVRGAGKAGAVKIICFDEETDTLAGVADGSIYGTIVQQPYEFGRQIVPTLAIKRDNVAEFSARLKKLLGQ